MTRRADAVSATRERIVAAARGVQAEQGIVTTPYEEIAARASVSQSTVYRHFPTLDTLIPACAADIAVLRPPTAELAAGLFAGLRDPYQRLARLVEGTCDCYERDGAWLTAARREDRLHRSLATLAQLAVNNLRFLVHAALEGTGATRELEQMLVALIDFPLWHSLQSAGFTSRQARQQVLALVRQQFVQIDRIEGRDGSNR